MKTRRVQLLPELRDACARAGGQRAWAQAKDVPEATLSLVLNGRREMPDSIINALGYLRREVFISAKELADAER